MFVIDPLCRDQTTVYCIQICLHHWKRQINGNTGQVCRNTHYYTHVFLFLQPRELNDLWCEHNKFLFLTTTNKIQFCMCTRESLLIASLLNKTVVYHVSFPKINLPLLHERFLYWFYVLFWKIRKNPVRTLHQYLYNIS